MDFIGKRKIWYIISLLVIVPGLFSIMVFGFNLGIDFAGGNLTQIQFEQDVKTEQVRDILNNMDLQDSAIQSSENNTLIIKTRITEQSVQKDMINNLGEEFGQFEILRSEEVGPTIGKELRRSGILAFIIAVLLMMAYITFRFEFKFAMAGISALFHDIIITIGFFSILQIEIDNTFIAALLTIFGYSINNTIVVFDRIRENLKKVKKVEIPTLVNTSINQTLARSINTTLTVMFVLLALFFFGGETTRNFVLALLIGVTSGLYSSIFIASSLWTDFRDFSKKKRLVKTHA